MKLTKKLEAGILEAYHAYWNAYLEGDSKKFASLLDDHVTVFGTAVSEVFDNKKKTVRFYKETAGQLVGKAKFRNRKIAVQLVDNTAVVKEQNDFYVLIDKKWTYYGKVRVSAVLKQTKPGWKLVHQHASLPDLRAEEGEQLAAQKIKEENLQLRDAVKRRTVELEEKNRELEIESALERVRARTMAMRNSNELGEVAVLLFQQIRHLGIETYASGFNIWDKNHTNLISWMSNPTGAINPAFDLPVETYEQHRCIYAAWKKKESFLEDDIKGKAIKVHYQFLRSFPLLDAAFRKSEKAGIETPARQVHNIAFFSYGFLLFITLEPRPQLQDIFIRFAKVFDQTYTRFLDLQKAEAQAREAQIEAALERVRSRSMGMQKSEELRDVIRVIYEQLVQLNFEISNAGFLMDYRASDDGNIWMADAQTKVPTQQHIPYFDHIFNQEYVEQKEKGPELFTRIYSFEEKNSWLEYLYKHLPWMTKEMKKLMSGSPALAISRVLLKNIGLYLLNYNGASYTDAENTILLRFGKVFEQAYIRFADLQKAEAQAREAQIETALERVRSRTMAMHQTSELQEVIHTVHKELLNLSLSIDGGSFVVINDDIGPILRCWGSGGTANTSEEVEVPHFNMPFCTNLIKGIKEGRRFFTEEFSQKEKEEFFTQLFEHKPWSDLDSAQKKETLSGMGGYTRSVAVSKYTSIFIINHHGKKFTAEENDILKRFAKVFEQTYTRFLDLQKAEAQAREALIEAALERVRSRAMAMHKSEELKEVAGEMRKQLGLLGQKELETCAIHLYDQSPDYFESWAALLSPHAEGEVIQTQSLFPKKGIKIIEEAIEAYTLHKQDYLLINEGEKAQQFFEMVKQASPKSYEVIATSTKDLGEKEIKGYWSVADFTGGSLVMTTMIEPGENSRKLLRRFANVFGLAYRRFVDLKSAEAQAREAKIEAALERVRARTLAMFKSDELSETAAIVFRQLIGLGIAPNRLYIGIINEDSSDVEAWATDEEGGQVSTRFTLSGKKNVSVKKMYDGWKEKKKSLVIDMQGEELHDYIHYLSEILHAPVTIGHTQTRRVQNLAFFSNGFIGIASPEPQPEETIQLLERFAAVFNLTYTRFNDLQVAEAQAREAKIEAALERVRARALAMQQPEELKDVARVLRSEMGVLGVEELETASIYIYDDNPEHAECWYALQDPKSTEKKMISDHFALNLNDTWVGREMLRFYNSDEKKTSIVMGGANRREWIEYCYQHSPAFTGFYGEVIPDRTYHLYKFSHGTIGAAAPGDISDESWRMLTRASSVFSLAYSRFRDLTKARIDLVRLKEEKQRAETALTELQATQRQLVQSEKMASLGELTAGIAHEIQNPLNFVNNFSEVSGELISELVDGVNKGNMEEVKAIARDIVQNLEKINHHGKRADAIVKGMLQHSRTGSGQKEMTDINALCDEYLRLAYHGWRAKDKSFNAKFETDFDNSIDKINIIPQEIGRVILNLINNAFYAVSEKQKLNNPGYDPTVVVKTTGPSALGDGRRRIQIRIEDNGMGIPEKVLDKIFQPFFTTKPTGQGTGLGLSLAYDIITKGHGGELKVETKEGEGTTFIIGLFI